MIDRSAVRRRFSRAASSYARAARLEAEVGTRMLERLDYVTIAPRRVLDAGCGPGRDAVALARRYRGTQVIGLDCAFAMLRPGGARAIASRLFGRRGFVPVCGDLERLPLAGAAAGLVWSNMALHWVGDPLAALREFHRVLEVEGLLMFSTLGPDTLAELRAAAGEARVHRFADMHDLGDMLVASGFSAPVMDMERITLEYASPEGLLADLRASGQTCALEARRRGLAGKSFLAALKSGLEHRRRGARIPATYEVVYGHAWKGRPARAADGRAVVRFEGIRRR
jgi:malonyl-CoA O-methyltransferase